MQVTLRSIAVRLAIFGTVALVITERAVASAGHLIH